MVAAHGTGSRSLGTYSVEKNQRLIIQLSCYGPPMLTIVGLLDLGPCGDGNQIATDTTKAANSRLTVTIQARGALRWAIYISQPG